MQNSVCQMEFPSLQYSTSSSLTTLPTSLLYPTKLFSRKSYFYGDFVKSSCSKKYPLATCFPKSHNICAQLSSGATRFSSSAVEATSENVDSKDDNVVFVAGATGKVGSRTVRELLKIGCRVKAGVRSAQRAEGLVQSVREMTVGTDATNERKPIEMLEIVECDLEKPDQIVPALSRASVVICCIGASEKEIFDVTGPYRIDFLATKNLIDAATVAKVNHFLLVTSLGTNKFGFPAAVLNLFWGVLCWKRKAEEALIASGLPFTIVRPGGMERPTDSFKETHNLTLLREDTLFGGLVSNLQVAELLAFMAQNRNLSYCKIMEVVAETTAPLTPMAELLVKIPSKREDLQVPQIPKAPTTPGVSTETSMVSKAASIVKEEELTEEKLVEQDAITKPLDTEPAKSFTTEVPTAVSTKESVQDSSMPARPLSPYTMYDDLKPPSSPCPTAPSGHTVQEKQVGSNGTEPGAPDIPTSTILETEADTAEVATVELQKLRPLSPYAVYEDLKPPSSPSPSPPDNSHEKSMNTSKTVDGVPKVMDGNGTLAADVQQELIFYHSPFHVYEDLKPPTSPTPAAPTLQATSMASADAESLTASSSYNGAIEPVEENNAGDDQTSVQAKPRPLSPYTMYDDLKPPSSPMPSSGNH